MAEMREDVGPVTGGSAAGSWLRQRCIQTREGVLGLLQGLRRVLSTPSHGPLVWCFVVFAVVLGLFLVGRAQVLRENKVLTPSGIESAHQWAAELRSGGPKVYCETYSSETYCSYTYMHEGVIHTIRLLCANGKCHPRGN